MRVGVQFTGTLASNQTQRWFTFNWPAVWHVIWTVMPVTPKPGAPELSWTVRVERASRRLGQKAIAHLFVRVGDAEATTEIGRASCRERV